MSEVELRTLKVELSDRLNNYLVEMKPGYDDSITGFNEAWDVMGKFFDHKIAALIAKQDDTLNSRQRTMKQPTQD